MTEQESNSIKLYIYDLSMGLSKILLGDFFGKTFDGIWHTSIVPFGKEYFFGNAGIEICKLGMTSLGQSLMVEDLGTTQVPEDIFEDYLNELRRSTYAFGTYNLLKHNCNTFSNEVSQFLIGQEIPKHIINLPDDIIQSLTNYAGEVSSSNVPKAKNMVHETSID